MEALAIITLGYALVLCLRRRHDEPVHRPAPPTVQGTMYCRACNRPYPCPGSHREP